MSKRCMCFAQLHGPDRETVEAAASIYSDGEELPPNQWSVRKSGSDISVVMAQEDMPEYWQAELKRWEAWGRKQFTPAPAPA